MSVIVHSIHTNIVPHTATACGLFGCDFRPRLALPFLAWLSRPMICWRVCRAQAPACLSTGVGVEPLFCLGFWDRGRACARVGGGRAEQGTCGSRTRKHREADCGWPEDGGVWTAKTVKQPPQQPQHSNYWAPLVRKRHGMPHPAQPQHTNYWAPQTRKQHQQEHWLQRQKAATRRNMRAEEPVTFQSPVKKQQPDGMSHRGGGR